MPLYPSLPPGDVVEHDGLASAQHHIAIASLYIGTEGGREADFLQALAAAAHDSTRAQLQIHVLLDALRSTRPTKTADGRLASTAELLSQALPLHPSGGGSRVALFHTPALRGLLRRLLPPRVREIVGVQHMKAYVFDDTLLISGANLSNTYFTNRQDRYLLVRHAPQLAAFVRQAVLTVSQFSYQLLPPAAAGLRDGSGSSAGDVAEATGSSWHAKAGGTAGGTALHRGPAYEGPGAPDLASSAVGSQPCADPAPNSAAAEVCRPVSPSHHTMPLRRRDRLALLLQRWQLMPAAQRGTTMAGQQGVPSSSSRTGGGGGGGGVSKSSSAGSPVRSGIQQSYCLGPPPIGLDPVRDAWAFSRSLRQGLMQLFVPRGGEEGAVDHATLAAELGEDASGSAGSAGAAPVGRLAAAWGGVGTASSQAVNGAMEGRPAGDGLSSSPGAQSQGLADVAVPAPYAGLADSSIDRIDPVQSPASSSGSCTGLADRLLLQDPPGAPAADTWVMPLVQAGFAGLRQDERCTLGMLSWAAQHRAASTEGLLQVSTPYLNLARPYEWLLGQSRALSLELLTSSPEANGFFGSKGMSGYIPQAYSLLEHRTWKRLTQHAQHAKQGPGQQEPQTQRGPQRGMHHPPGAAASMQQDLGPTQRINNGEAQQLPQREQHAQHGSRQLLEYNRPGWEFHAKGFWYTPAGSPGPTVTAVGSSNYGFRSLHRDTEMQFLVITRNAKLQEALRLEFERLKQHAHPVGESHFQLPGRRGGTVARLAVRLLRGFL
ncbi:hypothetical protein N2152v2_009511 [Parachlorella kessleri]